MTLLMLPPIVGHGAKKDARASIPVATSAGRADASIAPAAASEAYGNLPLSFVPNRGQMGREVLFSAQAGGFAVQFTPHEARLAFVRKEKGHVLGLRFVGANPAPTLVGRAPAPGKVNYLIGNDPAGWHTGLPTYGEVVYQELWPGIDMAFRGEAGVLKYEFLVRPGANPDAIRLAYAGAEGLSFDGSGNLRIATALGALTDARPTAYQDIGGHRVDVSVRYTLESSSRYIFAVDAHDSGQPLIVDPGLAYSTYLGGPGEDQGYGITVDAAGNVYVTGKFLSGDYPTTVGAFDTTYNGFFDAFVTKLNATGSALVYSTYLGGTDWDQGNGIAVDASGSAYVAGFAGNMFPTTAGAIDTSFNGGFADAFVAKLDPAGSALLYSTYLGGPGNDQGNGIAVDGSGSAYVSGLTDSSNFPTTVGAFDTTHNGSFDAFVTKLIATASTPLLYSTYLGGTGNDQVFRGIAVDASGTYVTGFTDSANFPTTSGAFDTSPNGGEDTFVTKVNTTSSAPLVYSTYLGGSGQDQGLGGIAVDASGSAYVTGLTDSSNFPTTGGAFDTTHNGGRDAYVTKLNTTGSAPLVYSTYLGGASDDRGFGIAVDASGSAYVTGVTNSSNFPTTTDAFDTSFNGGTFDAYVTKLNTAGSAPLVYSTYLGGSDFEQGAAIAVDASGNAYVTGGITSTNFPTTFGAFDTTFNGVHDAFVTKLDFGPGAPATLTLAPTGDTNFVGTQHCVTATVKDAAGNPVPNVTVRFSASGSVTTSGSAATNANGEATFCYIGPTQPGADAITAYADTDNDTTQDVGEPSGAAAKTWVAGPPTMLTLSPAADTNPVNTQHCVTATVKDAFGNPTPGVTVRFSVTGTIATGGSAPTNASGQATFCYVGPAPGADAISAYADRDQDNVQDPDEPFGAATKLWFASPATGQFVIGNLANHAPGSTVNFWGSQWAQNNPTSGGAPPSSFKGFANAATLACGGNWTSNPGNSSNPPSTVPAFMAVLVTKSTTKSGNTVAGNVVEIVIVRTNPGYGPSPGHAGTGTVVGVLCTLP